MKKFYRGFIHTKKDRTAFEVGFHVIITIIFIMLIFFIILMALTMNVFSQSKYSIDIEHYSILERSEINLLNEMGKIETGGQNTGVHIKAYHKYIGLNYANKYPYCAMLQCYVFEDFIPFKKSALANRIYDNFRKQGKKVKYIARRHNFIVWKNKRNYNGHIARIIKVLDKGWVLTAEGNTGNPKKNQREGDGNYIKRRNILHILGRMRVRGLCGYNIGDTCYTDNIL